MRLAEPTAHKEAIRSRPEILHVIAMLASHAGKKAFQFCTHHENVEGVKRCFNRLHRVFSRMEAIAEQLERGEVWALQLSVAFYQWLRGKVLNVPTEANGIIGEWAAEVAAVAN